RAFRVPRLAEQHHLARGAEPDQARQAIGREPGNDAVADRREPERRVRRRDAEVAAEDDLQAAAETGSLHGGDGCDRNRLDLRERDVPALEPIAAQAIAGERREIDAGAEGAAFAADDDGARAFVAARLGRGAVEVV